MLIVKLKVSATKPIAAGANKNDEKPIVIILTYSCRYTFIRLLNGLPYH